MSSTTISALQEERAAYEPKLPTVFRQPGGAVKTVAGEIALPATDQEAIQSLFPHTYGLPRLGFEPAPANVPPPITVGVVLSGGQAPGGHNVIAGLFDGLEAANAQNRLLGFLGGPKGILTSNYTELTSAIVDRYRNTGGFDIIGSGRDKIEGEAAAVAMANCQALGIDALVVIGGDDSNTNACVLAEYFLEHTPAGERAIQVVGCPKTVDGDLKNEWIEASFGFDTACKVYSELIGNIGRDALSAKKYWHFVKLMGRSASHIALECALQTRANLTLISEEVEAQQRTLGQIVAEIAELVSRRADDGSNFGIVLIPEGLVEFIPEVKRLISELNELLGQAGAASGEELAAAKEAAALTALGLTAEAAALYVSLPAAIRRQLVMDRDPHGNVQVAKIQTEQLLLELVQERLAEMREEGRYSGKFSAQNHYFGYEGRCAFPSNFDADYCYTLGHVAAALIGDGRTGYICAVGNLTQPAADWTPAGIPISSLMNIERRKGADKPVICKALVDLEGKPFKRFAAQRDDWVLGSDYLSPGPIQFYGPSRLCDRPTITLALESDA